MKDAADINQQVISLYFHFRKQFDQSYVSQNFVFLILSRIFHVLLLLSLKILHVLLNGKAVLLVTLLC